MSKVRIWILLVLCNLFWAGNYVFGKYVVAEMSPLWITFSRWFFAAIILLAIVSLTEKPDWRQVAREWPMLLVMALLGIVAYNMILYSALSYTSSTNAALVSALNPGVMVLFSIAFLKEKVSRLQLAGLGISLAGVLVVLTQGNIGQLLQMQYNKGDLLMLAAIVAWTLYSLVGKRIKSIPPITATAASAVLAALVMAPFAFYQGFELAQISTLGIVGIVYITLFPSVGSFVFWNMAVKEIGPSRTGISLNLIPVFTAIISGLLGNPITPAQILGGLLVFAGVYLTTGLAKRR